MRRIARRITAATFCSATLLAMTVASPASAQFRRVRGVPGEPGKVRLPYFASDGSGGQWVVYGNGMLQSQGPQPTFAQAAQLTVNDQSPQNASMNADLDAKTGELTLPASPAGSLTVERHLFFDAAGAVRVIDVVRNPTSQEQPVALRVTTSLNFGVQSARIVNDSSRADRPLAWVAATGNSRAAAVLFNGPGARVPLLPPADAAANVNTNLFAAAASTTIPANGGVAILHVYESSASTEAAGKWATDLKPEKLLADVSPAVRKLLINVAAGDEGLPDLNVLRGDSLDVVELVGGDRLVGDLVAASYKIDTPFGTVELPADRVVGLVTLGRVNARPLLVLTDGQAVGGELASKTIDLSRGGEPTKIPVGQIARVGYRRRPGEPEQATSLIRPFVTLSSGDRLAIKADPAMTLPLVTRYGRLAVPASAVSLVDFTPDDRPGPVVTLTDGSQFTAVLDAPSLTLQPLLADKPMALPVGLLDRLAPSEAPAVSADAPQASPGSSASPASLVARGGDTFAGTITNAVTLLTTFDAVTIPGAEVRTIRRPKDDAVDWLVVTADGTSITGRPTAATVVVKTTAAIEVQIPTAAVTAYTNPAAAPSPALDRTINTLLGELNNDDWKVRDAAQQRLQRLGPALASTLKSQREAQPPEVRQRIDAVLNAWQSDHTRS